jgi:iron uptake system component EfeO
VRATFHLTTAGLVPLMAVLTACGGGSDTGTASSDQAASEQAAGIEPIEVIATDTSCEVARDEAPAGTISFNVTNRGTKITEFYFYAEGGRVMGEVEDIGPGVSREFAVEVTEGGAYETACKPGMAGDGIRHPFTVT